MSYANPLKFVESARILRPIWPEAENGPSPESPTEPALDLDKLPKSVVSTNTLIDYSASSEPIRGGLSLAFAFACQAAFAEIGSGDDGDDYFAAYKTNLARLGFSVSQGAFVKSTFKKKGVAVHKAIIPFLTAALGGAGVGPVILALLQNLQATDAESPWIKLFDRQSRMFETREMHFAAVASDSVQASIRHVAASLFFVDRQTNVLFFKVSDMAADFESATTTLSINTALLASIEPALRNRLASSATDFISGAELKEVSSDG